MVGGKLHGLKKDHLVIVGYLPPRLTALESAQFFEKAIDVINEARTKIPEAWITVGGDWNQRPLTPLTNAFPDLTVVTTGPTRKDATLDITLTNYTEHVVSRSVNSPLESETDTSSDHS